MASPMLWLGVKPGLRRFPSEVDPWELFKTSGEAVRAAGVMQPAPSVVLDPVRAWCSPERSTFASKRSLRLSLNARPHVSRCKRKV